MRILVRQCFLTSSNYRTKYILILKIIFSLDGIPYTKPGYDSDFDDEFPYMFHQNSDDEYPDESDFIAQGQIQTLNGIDKNYYINIFMK